MVKTIQIGTEDKLMHLRWIAVMPQVIYSVPMSVLFDFKSR